MSRSEYIEAAKGRFIGGEAVAETLYYLPDHDDEVMGHDATLGGIARFLAEGQKGVPEDDGWYGEQAPAGEPQKLSVMDILADRTLTHIGGNQWRIDPPLPAACNFCALRWAPDQSWDLESIGDGSNHLTVLIDAYNLYAEYEKDRPIENVVFGVHHDELGAITWAKEGDEIVPVVLTPPGRTGGES